MDDEGQPDRSSENRVRMPRPAGGCHQCWTSPSSELAGRRPGGYGRGTSGGTIDQGHDILKLVAEPIAPPDW